MCSTTCSAMWAGGSARASLNKSLAVDASSTCPEVRFTSLLRAVPAALCSTATLGAAADSSRLRQAFSQTATGCAAAAELVGLTALGASEPGASKGAFLRTEDALQLMHRNLPIHCTFSV